MTDDQGQRVLDVVRTELGDHRTWGAPVGMRNSPALCALSSVHSLQGSTPSVRRVLRRCADHRDPER